MKKNNELSKKTTIAIEQARKRIKKGQFVTEEEAVKRLELKKKRSNDKL